MGRLVITDASFSGHQQGSSCDCAALSRDCRHSAGFEEIDVELRAAPSDAGLTCRLCEWVGVAAVASRSTLRSLRLSGPLCLGTIFQAMAPYVPNFTRLETVTLARGSTDWQPAVAARVLQQLPALRQLQFRFSFDDEDPPLDLLYLLLLPSPVPAALMPSAGSGLPPSLLQLQHLALVYPPRSVIPPSAPLPDALAMLTQLTALKLKRVPTTTAPPFLGALTNLRFLLWDPALPADASYTMPPGLSVLTQLQCLWLVTQWPLELPASLAANLEGLHVMARGCRDDELERQRWGWLAPFTRLHSLRLQGVGMQELPAEVASKGQLTRLDLMVNQLHELPPGPYLRQLQFLHVGNNRLSHFPSALLAAEKLECVYLANQSSSSSSSGRSSPGTGSVSSGGGGGGGSGSVRCSAGYTRRMELTAEDVEGLLEVPALHTLVMGNLQPVVLLGMARHDFLWLQQLLKQRGCRLTSNELAYPLQSKDVFDIPPLLLPGDTVGREEGGCGEEGTSDEATAAGHSAVATSAGSSMEAAVAPHACVA